MKRLKGARLFDNTPASVTDFNPFSLDAQVATVIEKLKRQDEVSRAMHSENKRVLGEILTQAKLTNGRVTKLELQWTGRWKYLAGAGAGISLACASFWKLFEHFAA